MLARRITASELDGDYDFYAFTVITPLQVFIEKAWGTCAEARGELGALPEFYSEMVWDVQGAAFAPRAGSVERGLYC